MLRPAFVALALASSSAAFAYESADGRFGARRAIACASGYHVDRGGNCQPDAGEQNRYCPRGLVFHPQFNGWSCDPPPPEAY